MDSPGTFVLAARQITVPLTQEIQTSIENLDGMEAVTIEAQFQYGQGGAAASAVVQTTMDGVTWRDIARFDFTNLSVTKTATIAAVLSYPIAPYVPLPAEGINDGALGNQLRALITSTGTYANTVLSVRVSAR